MRREESNTSYSSKYYGKNASNKVNDKWFKKYGSASDWAGVFIGIFVAFYTFALFNETQKSTKAAIDSAEAAQNTYKQQRVTDSITRYNENIKSIADSINTAKRFELDSISRELQNKTLAAQIQSIEETQKQFETSNEPYLQYTDPEPPKLEAGKTFDLILKLVNLGKYPVKVIENKSATVFRVVPPNLKEIYKLDNNFNSIINSYVINGSPLKQRITANRHISDRKLKTLPMGNCLYF
jgi:uncharacterized FlaG/YvyC family protein